MEWIESISPFDPSMNGWVLGGIGIGFVILIGCYSTRLLCGVLIVALLVAHHDFWSWTPSDRSFGRLPSGFVYHVGLSIVTAFVWWIVTLEAWPDDDPEEMTEAMSEQDPQDRSGGQA